MHHAASTAVCCILAPLLSRAALHCWRPCPSGADVVGMMLCVLRSNSHDPPLPPPERLLLCLLVCVFRRQKHTLKAAAKHRLQQQLKDPAARLKRLQAQLGTSPASAVSAAAAAASMAPTDDSSPPGAHARRPIEPGRTVSKQLSLQQQRSKAAEPFSRVRSMSGGGSSPVRVLQQSFSAKQQMVQDGSLSRTSTQKQHQGLVLPSIAPPSLPGSSSTAAGAVHQPVGGRLPKLQRL